jgi:hypothetical protein
VLAVPGPHPSLIPLLVVLGIAGLLVLAVLVALALDRGPSASDVALAYELAWDELEFGAVWSLSDPALRDGRTREAFVAAKLAAYRDGRRLARLTRSISVESVEFDASGNHAHARTRLELIDGDPVVNDITLERTGGRWQVRDYRLARSPAP